MRGGSEKAVKLHRSRGKLMVRERVTALLDPASPFLELSTLAGHTADGKNGSPSAGIVTGIGSIHGRLCMVVANDPTVKGGTYDPITIKKHLRAQTIALENALPCVYLVESGGGNLTTDSNSGAYADETGFGRIFFNQARLSAAGATQIAVVLGSCTAGGAYIPAMADEVVITKGQGTIFLAGPPLVKAATGEEVSDEDLGGGDLHCRVSGVADHLANDEPHALALARRIVAALPLPRPSALAQVAAREPLHPAEELHGLIPADARQKMNMRAVLARLLDGSELDEFKPHYGRTLITATAHIHGYRVGILANDGVLHSDSAVKGAHFIQLCCQRKLPLVFVQDVTGFMVGREAEASGIAKHGAKMLHALSCAAVPKLTLVVGGSFGAGNYAMCGRAYSPRFMWMWPSARIGVMGGEQASSVLMQVQLAAAKKAGAHVDAEQMEAMSAKVVQRFDAASRASFASARVWDDGIIEPKETRRTLALALGVVGNVPIPMSHFGTFRM